MAPGRRTRPIHKVNKDNNTSSIGHPYHRPSSASPYQRRVSSSWTTEQSYVALHERLGRLLDAISMPTSPWNVTCFPNQATVSIPSYTQPHHTHHDSISRSQAPQGLWNRHCRDRSCHGQGISHLAPRSRSWRMDEHGELYHGLPWT